MSILHILKSEPDQTTRTLMDTLSEGEETTAFALYEADPDYEKLLELIFENDRVVSWW